MSKQHIDLRTPLERIEAAVHALNAEGVNGTQLYQQVAAQSQVAGLAKALVAKGFLTEQELVDSCLQVQVETLEELLGTRNGLAYFYAHVSGEFSTENLLCWKAIESFKRKVNLDLLYLQNCCVLNDLKIMLRTIRVVLTGSGAL